MNKVAYKIGGLIVFVFLFPGMVLYVVACYYFERQYQRVAKTSPVFKEVTKEEMQVIIDRAVEEKTKLLLDNGIGVNFFIWVLVLVCLFVRLAPKVYMNVG